MTRAQQTISLALLVTSVPPSRFLIPRFLVMTLKTKTDLSSSGLLSVFPPIGPYEPQNSRGHHPCCKAPMAHARGTCACSTEAHHPEQLPLWALVSFGSYLLFKLGWGVVTFNNVPEAHKELMAEIEIARKDLKANGIDVD